MTESDIPQNLTLSGQDRDCVVLSVVGMTCGSCANAVHRVLSRVPGVVSAEVDLGSGRAMVLGSARPDDLVGAVEEAGYRAALASAREAPATGGKPGRRCCCG